MPQNQNNLQTTKTTNKQQNPKQTLTKCLAFRHLSRDYIYYLMKIVQTNGKRKLSLSEILILKGFVDWRATGIMWPREGLVLCVHGHALCVLFRLGISCEYNSKLFRTPIYLRTFPMIILQRMLYNGIDFLDNFRANTLASQSVSSTYRFLVSYTSIELGWFHGF